MLAICSPTRVFALSTNDRPDDSAAQLRLSNLKNSIESLQQQQQQDQEHQPLQQPSYLIEPSYSQLPAITRLLSRYRDSKRSWQNLQSSWGKRDNGIDGLDTTDELSADDYADLLLMLSKPYAVDVGGRPFIDENNNGELVNDEDFIATGEKRAWNKMNASWGKRLAAGRNNNGNSKFKFDANSLFYSIIYAYHFCAN